MNLSKTLGMALILALGLLLCWQFQVFDTPDKEISTEELLFPKVKIADVSFISIATKNRLTTIEKQVSPDLKKSHWAFITPEGNPVDIQAVNEVLSAISRLKSLSSIKLEDNSKQLKEYGLDKPEIVVSFKVNNKFEVLEFGKSHAFSGRRYLRLKGRAEVLLVNEAQVNTLNRIPFEFMDKTPLDFTPDLVREFWVAGFDSPVMQFVHESDGTWHVYSKGEDVLADSLLINDMLVRLSDLMVRHFVTVPDNALTVYGLKPPMVSIRLKFKDDSPEQLVYFGATKRLRGGLDTEASNNMGLKEIDYANYYKKDYAKVAKEYLQNIEWSYYFKTAKSPWIAKAMSPVHRAFLKPIGEYRNKELLKSIKIEDLESFSFKDLSKSKTREYRLNVRKDEWTIVEKESKEGPKLLDSSVIEKILNNLKVFRVLSFPEGVKPKSWDAEYEIVFNFKSKSRYVLEIAGALDSGLSNESKSVLAPRYGRFIMGDSKPILFIVAHEAVAGLEIDDSTIH